MTTQTQYGYKIPELEDKDFWDSYNSNFVLVDAHNHDGINSAVIASENIQEDAKKLYGQFTITGGVISSENLDGFSLSYPANTGTFLVTLDQDYELLYNLVWTRSDISPGSSRVSSNTVGSGGTITFVHLFEGAPVGLSDGDSLLEITLKIPTV